jgi:hypothetical protein
VFFGAKVTSEWIHRKENYTPRDLNHFSIALRSSPERSLIRDHFVQASFGVHHVIVRNLTISA